jgi:cytochrome c556
MNMDDQFLQRLRRDPPAGFAARLKWQLDRPAPTRPSRGRVLLVLAIFGTAFALVSPPARRALGDLFDQPVHNPQVAALPYPEAVRPPSTASARSRSALAPAAGQESPPAQGPDDTQAVASDAPAISEAPVRSNSVVGPAAALPTSLQQAIVALDTRQALFRLLALVTQPLSSMRAGHTPVDLQIARKSTHRLQVLTSIIPDVFRQDTRGFDVNSRAQDSIWTQQEGFDSKAEELTFAADLLGEAIASHDEAGTLKAIGQVELACQACHDVYRKN